MSGYVDVVTTLLEIGGKFTSPEHGEVKDMNFVADSSGHIVVRPVEKHVPGSLG